MTHPMFSILKQLDKNNIYYSLSRLRDDSIMITITIVGARIELDAFEDGHFEYSIFTGNEDVSRDMQYIINLINEEK